MVLDFIYSGREQGGGYGPAARNHYIIHLVLAGKGVLTVGGREYAINPHDAFILFPDEYAEYHPDAYEPWEYVWVDFYSNNAGEAVNACGFAKNRVLENAQPLEKYFELMRNAENMLEKEGYLAVLLGNLAKLFPNVTEKIPDDEIIDSAKSAVAGFYHRAECTTAWLSGKLSCSRSTLFRAFKKHLNTTPSKYIEGYRMKEARRLLMFSDLSVKSIAFSVGYEDQLHFSKVFKKNHGSAPSEWRKANAGI